MFYLRTFDTVHFPHKDGKLISFLTHTRKWNETVHFKLQNNDIRYVYTELLSKLLPQGRNNDELEVFNHSQIYDIITDNKELIFQDPFNTCHFLVLDDEGILVPTKFIDLTEDDDIVLYDNTEGTHYISSIMELNILEKDSPLMKEFSNHIVYSQDNGIVINDFMIIG